MFMELGDGTFDIYLKSKNIFFKQNKLLKLY